VQPLLERGALLILIGVNVVDRSDANLAARETEYERLRMRTDACQADASELRRKLEAATAAHQAERTRLDERHAASEARWLVEVDRARQGAKEAAKDHERQVKELRSQLNQLQAQREELKQDRNESRAELRSALALRAQAEKPAA
jgi:chromosome segregation ATPase